METRNQSRRGKLMWKTTKFWKRQDIAEDTSDAPLPSCKLSDQCGQIKNA